MRVLIWLTWSQVCDKPGSLHSFIKTSYKPKCLHGTSSKTWQPVWCSIEQARYKPGGLHGAQLNRWLVTRCILYDGLEGLSDRLLILLRVCALSVRHVAPLQQVLITLVLHHIFYLLTGLIDMYYDVNVNFAPYN